MNRALMRRSANSRPRPALRDLHQRRELGRYVRAEDVPGREGHDLGPRPGTPVRTRGAGAPLLAGCAVRPVRAPPAVGAGLPLAALSSFAAVASGAPCAARPAGTARVDHAGEERLIRADDDADPPAATAHAAAPAVAPVPAGSPGLRRAAGRAGGTV